MLVNDGKINGITTLDRLAEVIKKGYQAGYIDESGKHHPNAFITNNDNELLQGMVSINPADRKIEIMKEGNFLNLVEDHVISVGDNYLLEDAYRSAVYLTGDQDTALFQKAIVTCVKTAENREFFPGEKTKKNLLKSISLSGVAFADEESKKRLEVIERIGIEKFNAINAWLMQFQSNFAPSSLVSYRAVPAFISEPLLNIFQEKGEEKYTFAQLRTVIASLKPSELDSLYNDDFFADAEGKPQFNRFNEDGIENKDYWINTLNHIDILDDIESEEMANMINFVFEKDFFRSWLLLIQNNLEKESSIFSDYENLNGKRFSTQQELESRGIQNEETLLSDKENGIDDFALIAEIRDAMIEILGLPAYTLLIFGLLTFKEQNDEIVLDFNAVGFNTLLRIYNRYGLRAFSALNDYDNLYGKSAFSTLDDTNYPTGILHLGGSILFGFTHFIPGMRIVDGKIDTKFKGKNYENSPKQHQGFLKEFFKIYRPIHRKHYASCIRHYLDGYYDPYFSGREENINRELEKIHYESRINIFEAIEKKLDLYLQKKFEQVPNYKEERDFIQTERMAKFLLMEYILRPGQKEWDYVKVLRDAYLLRKDKGTLTIKGTDGGKALRAISYFSNTILQNGIDLQFTHKELAEMIEPNLITCLYNQVGGKMNREGYSLDVLDAWDDAFEQKYIEKYQLLKGLFEKTLENGDNQITLKFFAESGAGFKDAMSTARYPQNWLGINEYREAYDLNEPKKMHEAIQTILFYTAAIPDLFCFAFKGQRGALITAIDAYGAYQSDYIHWRDGRNSPRSYWEQEGQGVYYAEFAKKFREIHSPGDIPFWFAFYKIGSDKAGYPYDKEAGGRQLTANRIMFRLLWQKRFRPLFENVAKDKNNDLIEDKDYIGIFDFTRANYLTKL